jgi:hypothetical protein
MDKQITVDGITYDITGIMTFDVNGKQRHELRLRRPKGRKTYTAVVYENGTMSEVIG